MQPKNEMTREANEPQKVTIKDENGNIIKIMYHQVGRNWRTTITINGAEYAPMGYQTIGIAKQFWSMLKKQIKNALVEPLDQKEIDEEIHS